MNCPNCKTGILESIGYIELKPGPLELKIDTFIPDETPLLSIMICSKDPCGFTDIKAAPASLTLAKRFMREQMYSGSCHK